MDTWRLFFVTVVGWQYHPGVVLKSRLSLEQCALVADAMMSFYADREALWRTGPQ